MAIQTEGFKPTNFPQYQPVNPALQGFNPSNVTQGALEGIQVQDNLEQLKKLRAHEAEWAAMADTRNKKLKAETKMAEILADHERQMAQIRERKGETEAAKGEKTAESSVGATNAQNTVITKSAEASIPNIAPAAAVDAAAIKGKLFSQNLQNEAQVETQDIARDAAWQSALKAKYAAELEVKKAQDEITNFGPDTDRARRLGDAAIALKQAEAADANARAAFNLKRPDIEAQKAANSTAAQDVAIKMHKEATSVLRNQQMFVDKLGDDEVPDPANPKVPTKVRILAAQLMKNDKGEVVVRKTGRIFDSDVKVDPNTVSRVSRFLDSEKQLDEYRTDEQNAAVLMRNSVLKSAQNQFGPPVQAEQLVQDEVSQPQPAGATRVDASGNIISPSVQSQPSQPQPAPAVQPSKQPTTGMSGSEIGGLAAATALVGAKPLAKIFGSGVDFAKSSPRVAEAKLLAKRTAQGRLIPALALGTTAARFGNIGVLTAQAANYAIGKALSDKWTGNMSAIEGIASALSTDSFADQLKAAKLDEYATRMKMVAASTRLTDEQKLEEATRLRGEIDRLK